MAATLEQAVSALKAGAAVMFPTDTVYGLGVAVRFAESPQLIYDLKRRDAGKPVAWLVGGPEDLDRYGRDVPAQARSLANKHWPGALTVIVKASDEVPPAFRAPDGSIALRMPDNAIALALIAAVGPIATSSANVSGQQAPRSFADVDPRLRGSVVSVEQEGSLGSGVASTVIDCSKEKTVIIRQGEIMSDQTFSIPLEFESCDASAQMNAKLWTSSAFGNGETGGAVKPKGVIQIVHGMAEYIDRYDELAEYFVSRGFVVCAEDHIGHGKSAADSSEYGHMPVNGGKDVLLGNVHKLREIAGGLFPDVPYIVYGHSMGSFIVREYIARHGEGLAACVLSGTGHMPAAVSKLGRTLARTLARLRGERYRSKLIDGMGAGAYGKQIPNARTPLDWLSTDESVVDAYIADDRCGFMFTVGGYATLLDMTAEIVDPAFVARVPKDLPVLFVAGEGDPVGDMGKGVRAAAESFRAAGVKRVDEKIYPGMRHEIHNEVGREQVYDDIATWIEGAVS